MQHEEASRNLLIFQRYRNGLTLNDISLEYKITRSRAQQIVQREMRREIIEKFDLPSHPQPSDEVLLKLAIKQEIDEIAKTRDLKRRADNKNLFLPKIKDIIDSYEKSNKYLSIVTLAKLMGTNTAALNKMFPDLLTKLKSKADGKWSFNYDQCRECKNTHNKHRSNGYCIICYPKSDIFKEYNRKSRKKYSDILKVKQREYQKEYHTRPEIIAKFKNMHDKNNFNGNRTKALEKYLYQCYHCSLTQQQSLEKTGRELYVNKLDSDLPPELDNLIVRCQNCHLKYHIKNYNQK